MDNRIGCWDTYKLVPRAPRMFAPIGTFQGMKDILDTAIVQISDKIVVFIYNNYETTRVSFDRPLKETFANKEGKTFYLCQSDCFKKFYYRSTKSSRRTKDLGQFCGNQVDLGFKVGDLCSVPANCDAVYLITETEGDIARITPMFKRTLAGVWVKSESGHVYSMKLVLLMRPIVRGI